MKMKYKWCKDVVFEDATKCDFDVTVTQNATYFFLEIPSLI